VSSDNLSGFLSSLQISVSVNLPPCVVGVLTRTTDLSGSRLRFDGLPPSEIISF
jgi:hypothetical protein